MTSPGDQNDGVGAHASSEPNGGSPPSTDPVIRRVVSLDITPGALVKLVLTFFAVRLFLEVWPVAILVLFSLMLTAAFNPFIRRLQARVTRGWAVLALVLMSVAVIVSLVALLVPPLVTQLNLLIQRAPVYARQLHDLLAQHHIHLNVQDQVQMMSARLSGEVPQIFDLLSNVMQGAAGVIVVLVLSVYLLLEGPKVGTAVLRLVPREKRLGARQMVAEMGVHVGGYIRGQLIASALAGVFSFVILIFNHVPQALALAALAAVMDVVPFVGILIATGAATLMALTTGSVAKALWVFVLYLIYHQVESHIIVPNVYGNTLGLSLSITIISILIGIELLGLVGAIIALPVAAAIPSVVNYIQEWREGSDGPEGQLP